MTTNNLNELTRTLIEELPAGPDLRDALVRQGLWDAADPRDPTTDPEAALAVRSAIVRRPDAWEPYYAEFRQQAGDSSSWVTNAELEAAWKNMSPVDICRNALLACLKGT